MKPPERSPKRGVKTLSQLAKEYETSPTTFKKMIAPLQKLLLFIEGVPKRLYTPREVEIIYGYLGEPG